MKMCERPIKSAEYSIVENLNKNGRTTKHFASIVQYFVAKVDALLGRPNKKSHFKIMKNETVDPKTVKGPAFFYQYSLWIGIHGKYLFILEELILGNIVVYLKYWY